MSVTPLEVVGTTSKFDLTLYVIETEQGLRCDLEYSTDLFEASTITRLLANFQTLLQGIVDNAQMRLSDLPLLSSAERGQVLVQWNATESDYPQDLCVHQLFEQQVQRTPDAVALVFQDETLSYTELNRRANQLAHHLHHLSHARVLSSASEILVGICMQRSIEMIVGLLAVLKVGGAYVPMDPELPQERLAFLLSDSQIAVLLTQQRLLEAWPELSVPAICLDDVWTTIEQEDEHNLGCLVNAEHVACVIYTSGSTGRPKGVLTPHRAILNRLAWMWQSFPFEAQEICCQKTSLSFVDSVWEIFGPLLQGIRIVLISDETLKAPHQLIEALSREQITRIVLVPSLLRVLLNTETDLAKQLPDLKYWTSSGEALSGDLAMLFVKRLAQKVWLLRGSCRCHLL